MCLSTVFQVLSTSDGINLEWQLHEFCWVRLHLQPHPPSRTALGCALVLMVQGPVPAVHDGRLLPRLILPSQCIGCPKEAGFSYVSEESLLVSSGSFTGENTHTYTHTLSTDHPSLLCYCVLPTCAGTSPPQFKWYKMNGARAN